MRLGKTTHIRQDNRTQKRVGFLVHALKTSQPPRHSPPPTQKATKRAWLAVGDPPKWLAPRSPSRKRFPAAWARRKSAFTEQESSWSTASQEASGSENCEARDALPGLRGRHGPGSLRVVSRNHLLFARSGPPGRDETLTSPYPPC